MTTYERWYFSKTMLAISEMRGGEGTVLINSKDHRNEYYRLSKLLIESVVFQKQAEKVSFYGEFTERGAFALNDAAHALREAIKRLEIVSAFLIERAREQRQRAA